MGRNHYIAYGSQADFCSIDFFGGPLDGSTIRTDVFPEQELFIHRVHDRNYFYRYLSVGPTQFRAEWHGFQTEPTSTERSWTALFRQCAAYLLSMRSKRSRK